MDEQLVLSRLRQGDGETWREVLRTHGPLLLGYAKRLMANRADAEEVVQDALVSVYKSFPQFKGHCSIKAWLFRAVHNKSIDELRRRKRFIEVARDDSDAEFFGADGRWARPLPDWEGSPGARIDAERILEVVRAELDQLPHEYREILLLKEAHGLSTAEICDIVDISPGNLRVRLHRARKALRAAVSREFVEE